MPKGTATVLLGVTVGLVGILVYARIREIWAEDEAEALIDCLTQELLDLEAGAAFQGR